MLVQCKTCDKTFDKMPSQIKKTNNHFCSRSCAVSFNNKGVQRNSPIKRICNQCDIPFFSDSKHKSRILCIKCSDGHRKLSSKLKRQTLKEMWDKESVKGKHPSWKSSYIRNYNRSWNKDLLKHPCQYCNYSTHVELCHIKAVSSFDESATVGEVNDPSNNLVLCRNHHWEFDNNILNIEDIPPRE